MSQARLSGSAPAADWGLRFEIVVTASAGLAAAIVAAAMTSGNVHGEGAALAALRGRRWWRVPIAVGLYAWHHRPRTASGRDELNQVGRKATYCSGRSGPPGGGARRTCRRRSARATIDARARPASAAPSPCTLPEVIAAATIVAASPAMPVTTNSNLSPPLAAGALPESRTWLKRTPP